MSALVYAGEPEHLFEMAKAPFTICVVGGGFTGAATAIACLTRIDAPFRLVMIESGPSLGRGIAYGSHHPLHLLNVRARDLSIRAGQPGDFLNWAFRHLDQGENHALLHEALAHTFLPRQLFGEYVRQRLFETVAQRSDVTFSVVNGVATACVADGGRYRVALGDGAPVLADIVFLATAYGLPSASTKGALQPFEPVPPGELAGARTIAIIGSGLTMADVLLSARRDGFQGTAYVVSRRGQLPRSHAPQGVVPQEVALPRSKHVSMLAAAIRIACEMAEEGGTPWQAIINGLRPSLQQIWQGLPIHEQSRFLRHLRPFWDSHRHRLPMEVHARITAEFADGRAVLLRGSVKDIERDGRGFALTLQRRGRSKPEVLAADLAFDCSGFKPDLRQKLIASLTAQNLARPDAHNVGLAVEPDGRLRGGSGRPSTGLYAIGPLCQGTLWEITSVPEIVAQADRAAGGLAMEMQARAATEQTRAFAGR
jgi:uncharacterized NAD(P)/FAD-binding protein YdhS